MDLIREILMGTADGRPVSIDNFSPEEVWYHVWLLKEAGYIEALVGAHSTNQFQIFCLTWQGNEFLDAMRDDTLWNKAKEKFVKPGASWTAQLVFEWLKGEVRRRIMGEGS